MVNLIATGDDGAELDRAIEVVRGQIAFYGSTPAYAADPRVPVAGGRSTRGSTDLSKEGRWDDMAALIPDEVLEAVAIVGRRGDIAGQIRAKVAGVADTVSLECTRRPDPGHFADICAALRAGELSRPAQAAAGRVVHHPPAVPGHQAPVGPERLAQPGQLLGVGMAAEAPRPAEPGPHPVVAGRPDVEAAQRPEQEHLGRPGPDAPHPGEVVHHLLVREAADPVEGDPPAGHLVGQVPDRGGLGPAQAGRGQQLVGGAEHRGSG